MSTAAGKSVKQQGSAASGFPIGVLSMGISIDILKVFRLFRRKRHS